MFMSALYAISKPPVLAIDLHEPDYRVMYSLATQFGLR